MMAQDSKSVVTPQHFLPPNGQTLRAQAVQRLQVGLFGLSAMLLLVGLANIIMDRARQTEAQEAMPAVIAPAAQEQGASDPLADIGVVPSAEPTADARATGQAKLRGGR